MIRLVTGVSKATSEAVKPGKRGQQATRRLWRSDSTDVAWEHQEVIVCQAADSFRVQQCFRVETISIRVLMAEYFECFCMVEDLLFRQNLRAAIIARIPIGEGHSEVVVLGF